MNNVQIRLRDRTLLFRYLVIINLIVGAWYLHWRITQSVNTQILWFSVPLLLAEIYMFLGGVLFLIGLWRPIERQVRSLSQLRPRLPEADYPTVDVFITCYSEPADIVAATARAALQMDYPAEKLRVYILDDGGSANIRAAAEQLCQEDLQSPALQNISTQLVTERYRLQSCLAQLMELKQDAIAADELLTSQRLVVPSSCNELNTVISWFDSLRHPTVPDKVWYACQTMLGEGFDNAVYHAHKNLASDFSVEIEAVLLSSAIILRLWDHGDPFDFEAQRAISAKQIDAYAEQGRGIGILDQLADYLAYVRTSDSRNCLVIIKRFEPTISVEQPSLYKSIGYLQGVSRLLIQSCSRHRSITEAITAEVEQLTQQIAMVTQNVANLGRCGYIAREKPPGRAHHAKAGNINHAIFCGETQGEFILTLDADHIPQPQFLQRVLPNFLYFNLEQGRYELNGIAFVQTPQAFYNLPEGDPFGHDAHFFYGPIQQGKDGMNAAFYTGTNAVLRREALVSMGLQHFAEDFAVDQSRLAEFEMISGLSSISITEDMNTAMRLHAAGWQSAYHHEVLAKGLAPDDLSSTLKQKLRWAQGTIQVLVKDNPLLKPGLTFWQRLQYFQTMYSYFSGFFVAIFLACPIISCFTGLIPVSSFGLTFALHFIPAYLLNRLTLLVAGWEVSRQEIWRNEQYAIALFPIQIQAVLSVLIGRKILFQVTPKQRQSGVYFSLIRTQLAVFALTSAALIWGTSQLLLNPNYDPVTYGINAMWAVYHLMLLWAVIRAAYWQPKEKPQPA